MFSSCRVCGRPLKSKKSAEKGIGPGCEKRLMYAESRMEAKKAAERAKLSKSENFIDEIKEENMKRKCDRCGKEIRFIKRAGTKALVVNVTPVFFLPDDLGDIYVMTNGSTRRGTIAPDGIKGFILHSC